MAKRKTLTQRVAALERKAGGRSKSKSKGGRKKKVSPKAKAALSKVNRFAKEIRRKNPRWSNSRVMKAAGAKYRKC